MLFVEGSEFHHLVRVLRRQVGDLVIAIFPNDHPTHDALSSGTHYSGTQYLARISRTTSERAELIVLEIRDDDSTRRFPSIHLILGLLQPRLLDFVVEKTCELGITSLQLFRGEKSKVQELTDNRTDRLTRLAEAAAKQSGVLKIPRIDFFTSLKSALTAHSSDRPDSEPHPCAHRLLCTLRNQKALELAFYIEELKQSVRPANPRRTQGISPSETDEIENRSSLQPFLQNDETYLVVGPESGLTQAEEELAITSGYRPVSLGPTVLRAETAAVVAVAVTAALLRQH